MSHYIVRGKDGVDVWWQYLADGDWDTTTMRSEATALALSPALRAAEEMRQAASHVCVLAVSGDGTETPLPTYEEALAALQTSRAQAIAEAATWLRKRANARDAEVDDDCDGEDADRFCAEANALREAADDMEEWSK